MKNNDSFNKNLLGERIASGGDRIVYKYNTNEVAKVSTLGFIFGTKLEGKLKIDYSICREYLLKYILETRQIDSTKEHGYIEIQNYIDGEFLAKKHLLNPEIRQQFEEITDAIEIIKNDGYSPIDLVGNKGLFRGRLSNILVTERNRLVIIDTTLLESKSLGALGFILETLMFVVRIRQKYLIKRFLK